MLTLEVPRRSEIEPPLLVLSDRSSRFCLFVQQWSRSSGPKPLQSEASGERQKLRSLLEPLAKFT